MRINITQQHIDAGGDDVTNDAIFLALSERFGPGEFPHNFMVGASFLWLGKVEKYAISDELANWISDSDEGRPIKPITIEIDKEQMTATIAKEQADE